MGEEAGKGTAATSLVATAASEIESLEISIQLPARKWPPTLAAVTPGRSLTSSVLGRGPTANIRTLFDIQRKAIGEGQYGKVYLCTEKSTGQVFACKTIARSTLISVEDVEDVRTEVNVMYHLQGKPNVVKIKGTYEDRQDVHIVMELCSGGELFEEINRRCEERAVPYSERDAAKLCKAVVKAVQSCHGSGIIHRDLKPENFLFTSKGQDAILKAADFGMAAFFKPGDDFSRVCGSCMYMAPEVVRLWENMGRKRYDASVDVWAAGVICYILLSGSYPFLPPSRDRSEKAFRRVILNASSLPLFSEPAWRRISPSAIDFVKQMLQVDPTKRPSPDKILQHPWMEAAPEEPLEREVLDKFRNFLYVMRLKKVKKVALRAMVESMEEEDIADVRNLLSAQDKEATGTVAMELLPAALSTLGFSAAADAVTRIMQEICLHGKVLFDYSDFFTALLQLSQIERQENLFKAFALYDQDLSGYINLPELQQACEKYRVNRSVVKEMMQEITRSPDGRVDYNEFVAMMRMQAGGLNRASVERHIDNGSLKEMDPDY